MLDAGYIGDNLIYETYPHELILRGGKCSISINGGKGTGYNEFYGSTLNNGPHYKFMKQIDDDYYYIVGPKIETIKFGSGNGVETIVSIPGIEDITSFDSMFRNVSNIKKFIAHDWNMSNLKDVSYMCYNNSSIEEFEIKNSDISKLNQWTYAFYDCENLKSFSINGGSIPAGTIYFTRTFIGCSNLKRVDLSVYKNNTLSVRVAFSGCSELEEITPDLTYNDLINTFSYCSKLKEIYLKTNITKVGYLGSAFTYCTSLETIVFAPDSTVYSESSFVNFFTGCESLVTLRNLPAARGSVDLSDSPKLSYESVLSVIQSRPGTSNVLTLSLHTDVYNSLTPEDIAVATNKGWTVIAVEPENNV